MKTHILTLAIIALALVAPTPSTADTALDQRGGAGKIRINGHVLQRLADGALVSCQETRLAGVKKAVGIVFVRGWTGADQSGVNMLGTLSGTYRYTAVSGAAKIVDAYVVEP